MTYLFTNEKQDLFGIYFKLVFCILGATEWDYSYHHIQNFTKTITTFKSTIEKSHVNGGGDAFEGGMDGIMQTIACKGKYVVPSQFP